MENEQAAEILKEFTEGLDRLRSTLSRLNTLENSTFAETACHRSLYYMDSIKDTIIELARSNNQNELALEIKATMSAHNIGG